MWNGLIQSLNDIEEIYTILQLKSFQPYETLDKQFFEIELFRRLLGYSMNFCAMLFFKYIYAIL